jgi:hypothetical protein
MTVSIVANKARPLDRQSRAPTISRAGGLRLSPSYGLLENLPSREVVHGLLQEVRQSQSVPEEVIPSGTV